MRPYFFILFISLINFHLISQSGIVVIKGTVNSQESNEAVENAHINLKLSKGFTLFHKTDSTGKYEFKFQIDLPSTFTVSIASDKYTRSKTNRDCGFLASKDVGIGELEFNTEYVKDFQLNKVHDCGSRMSAVLFYTNSIINCNDSLNKIDSLSYDSFEYAINSLCKTLKNNPTIIIELQGHASMLEKNAEHLSLYRTQLIKEILIAKGINRGRIMIKGWGNKKLLIKDNVIKKAKTKEDKLALHAKNQRVLFRIISWDYKE